MLSSRTWMLMALGLLMPAAGCMVSFDREFDFDGDSFGGSVDCNDDNPDVHPGVEACEADDELNCDGIVNGCPDVSPTPEDEDKDKDKDKDDDAEDDDDASGNQSSGGNHGQGSGSAAGNGVGNSN